MQGDHETKTRGCRHMLIVDTRAVDVNLILTADNPRPSSIQEPTIE